LRGSNTLETCSDFSNSPQTLRRSKTAPKRFRLRSEIPTTSRVIQVCCRQVCCRQACCRQACCRQACCRQVCGRQVCGRQVCGRQVCGRQVCGRQVCGRQVCGRQTGVPGLLTGS
uniref:Uncharacterized protein n=1 Tax=Gadus morhua TaxID=8049 RepID=A0A8C5CHV2_GADMO